MNSTLYSRHRATGARGRNVAESGAKMARGNTNTTNNKDANSSTQANEERPKERYRFDEYIATMLGEKLDKFTAVFKAYVPEPPPKLASPKELWDVLGKILDLEDDDQLAIYDVLVADDLKFRSSIPFPQGMKKKRVLKQIKT
jgi:hypothetical protein